MTHEGCYITVEGRPVDAAAELMSMQLPDFSCYRKVFGRFLFIRLHEKETCNLMIFK